jgi:DNA-binding protein WhiA
MSLSDDVKRELARVAPTDDCDRLAELSGLFHSAGRLHLRGRGDVSLHLDVSESAVARRAFTLLRELGVDSEIRTYRRRAFDRATRYQLHVEGGSQALQILQEAGVVGPRNAPLERPPRRVVRRACCRRAYLRGALLGGGSVSGPRAPHLEIRATGVAGAEFLADVARRDRLQLHVLDRGRHAVAYAKGAAAISDLLNAAGAGDAVLSFEERAVVGATRARANRLANADHANLVRTAHAAHRQAQAVTRLAASGRLETLPPRLREAADLRLRHPTLSLRALGGKCRPPVTKAAFHQRLARIVELSEM